MLGFATGALLWLTYEVFTLTALHWLHTSPAVGGIVSGLCLAALSAWGYYTRRLTLKCREAERTLRQSRAEFTGFYEGAHCGYHSLDAEGRITAMNATELAWLGYSREELVGKRFFSELSAPEARLILDQSWSAFVESGTFCDLEHTLLRKDGRELPVLLNLVAVRDQAGRLIECRATAFDITARKEAEKAWKDATHEASRANRAKNEFLSRMSHELRTPLHAILGFAQLLEMDALEPEHREGVEQILKAGDHLLELINEVLDISKIEAGRLSLAPEPISVEELLHGCVQWVRPLATRKQVEVSCENAEAADAYVLADKQRLKQVLLNVFSNAVKFNRDHGRVTFRWDNSGEDMLRIQISDTGFGILPEDLSRVFHPFDRLRAERQGIEGTGLGLALSKRLVELMGGRIGVESTPPLGSSFWVELPRTSTPQASSTVNEGGGLDYARIPGGGESERTLLYIEDTLSNLRLIEHIFVRQPEIHLVAAMNGSIGVELAREHLPHLILLDLNLQDLPGLEVLRRLKADASTRDCPVVVISADAAMATRDLLLAEGAYACLTKPLDVRQFLAMIESVLAAAPTHPWQAAAGVQAV